MNIKEAKLEAINAIKSYLTRDENGDYLIPANRQRPLVFMGAAGIGKTDIARQIAQELKIGFLSYTITHHTRQSAAGLPKLVAKSYQSSEVLVTEYTMSEIISSVYETIERTGMKQGILFIDEFNCASETMTATMLQLLQNKSFGTYSVPEGWKIVLAGNPAEYNKSVKELDIVTADRLRIINIDPDFEAWREYGALRGIHPSIMSYLTQNQSHLCLFKNNKGNRQIVTPRGWEELSHSLYTYEHLGIDITSNMVSQFISSTEISIEFSNYYRLFKNVLTLGDIEKILNGTIENNLKDKIKNATFDVQYAIVWILTNRLKTSADKFVGLTNICDEIHKLLKEAKNINSLDLLYKAKVSPDSEAFLRNCAVDCKSDDFDSSFEIIKQAFNSIVLDRENQLKKADLYTTNILKFLKGTFGMGGMLEMFVSNMLVDPVLVSILTETNNQEYKTISQFFSGTYDPIKLKKRSEKIS